MSAPRHCILIFTLIFLATPISSVADQTANVVTRAAVERLNDAAANEYNIRRVELSGDGRWAIFTVVQTVVDSRGCFSNQIRAYDLQTGSESLLIQGQSYNTGVGNNCNNTLYLDEFSVDFDGSTIVVAHKELVAPPDTGQSPPDEYLRLDRATTNTQVIVQELDTTVSTVTTPRRIRILGRKPTISGDGATMFFMNEFGPDGDTPDGDTIYAIDTSTGAPTPLISKSQVSLIPGKSADADQICCANPFPRRPIETDFVGSRIAFLTSVIQVVTQVRDLVIMDTAGGPAGAQVAFSTTDNNVTVATGGLSSNGSRIGYSVRSNADINDDGVFVQDLNPLTLPQKAVPATQFRLPDTPVMSADGSALVFNTVGGGNFNYYWAAADGTRTLPVSLPATFPANRGVGISNDGQTVVYTGQIRPDGQLGGGPGFGDLIRFDLGNPAGFPALTSALGVPSVLMGKDPFIQTPYVEHTFLLGVTGATDNLLSFAYGPTGLVADFFRGEHPNGAGIPDDGVFDGDLQAGDGIYTDANLSLSDNYLPDTVWYRLALPDSAAGKIGYADIVIPTLGDWDDNNDAFFFTSTVGPVVMGTTGVTLTFVDLPGNTRIGVEYYDIQPPNRPNALPGVWRISDLNTAGTPFDLTLEFAYDEGAVASAELDESSLALFVSDSGGDSWQALPTAIDPVTNSATTILGNSVIPLMWALDTTSVDAVIPGGVSSGAMFGSAVSVDHNTVVIGAPMDNRVIVYRLEGDQLIEEATIDVPPGFTAQEFGAAVAVSGGTLVIGAPGTQLTTQKGPASAMAAAIFNRVANNSWSFDRVLPATNSNPDARMGESVAISGTTVVVGAPDDAEGEASGAAYVFSNSGAGFVLEQKIKPQAGEAGQRFGAAVAAALGRVAVGSPGAGVTNRAGSVTVYNTRPGSITRVDEVTGSGSSGGDRFGTSIGISADLLTVGAPNEDAEQGAAYTFSTADLVQTARIKPDQPANGAHFGAAVATGVTGTAVGAPDDGNGAVYRFDKSGAQTQRLGAGITSGFGSAVDLYRDRLIMGAPLTDASRGSARLDRDPGRMYGDSFEN